jgi:hypothetical protein
VLELPAVRTEALDPDGLVRSGVGWRSISRVSMVATYVMIVGGGGYNMVLPGYPVCAQAGKCSPSVCSIIVEPNCCCWKVSVGNRRVTLKSVCR